jgi:hypothetical protein
VPPPLTVQFTPALFLSFVIAAVSVTESVASTVVAEAVTDTLMGFEPPPQPISNANKIPERANPAREIADVRTRGRSIL